MQESEKRREELKRLKNLKKQEILDKIEKLKDVTGEIDVDFTARDVEGEFDEREYDEMMKVRCHLSVFNIYNFSIAVKLLINAPRISLGHIPQNTLH